MHKTRVGIIGASGYTALELFELLLRHPHVSIELATSRASEPRAIEVVHPSLRGRLDLQVTPFDIDEVAQSIDCAFCCLPHAASAEIVASLLNRNIKVVDFSADYRLSDVDTYEKWYGVEHPDRERVGTVAYGLPELFADAIANADLVANPGCFPTSAILPIAPLVQQDLIETTSIIVDAKTGVSGAGRTPKLPFHFPECNESVAAYSVGQHRHTPEINQIVQRFSNRELDVVFTPHLIPMDRGILSTIYVNPKTEWAQDEWLDALETFYAHAPFVRIVSHLPTTKHVQHSNYCDITVRTVGRRLVIISAIDNLIKGASGAAVQNFNLMHGFDESTALC